MALGAHASRFGRLRFGLSSGLDKGVTPDLWGDNSFLSRRSGNFHGRAGLGERPLGPAD